MIGAMKSYTRSVAIWITAIFFLLPACALLHACGGGSVVVAPGKPGNPITGEPGETNIGSVHPSAIQIPRGVASLESYAYVLTANVPLGIFRYDLEAEEAPYPSVTYSLLGKIQGIPDELLIVDEDSAFITTSGGFSDAGEGIHLFDLTPPTAEAFSLEETVRVLPVTFDSPQLDSAENSVAWLQPRYTAGVAESKGKLYVVTSNFTAVGGNPVCPPGTVLIYSWDRDPDASRPTIEPSSRAFLVTTGYNPTEVTALGERFVLVTNTGVIAIGEDTLADPLTEGSVDVIDTEEDCIVATYPLGMGAPSYKPIAITRDRSRALLGSVAYNAVYELDLTVLDDYVGSCPDDPDDVPLLDDAVLAGFDNPILVGLSQRKVKDFIVQVVLNWDDTRAYATGSDSGTLSILEVETREGVPSPKTAGQVLSLTPPLGPRGTLPKEAMPGPLAVRPGNPKTYSGPDLFVLIGWGTGKMLSLQTY
jgi:hypothetical protein